MRPFCRAPVNRLPSLRHSLIAAYSCSQAGCWCSAERQMQGSPCLVRSPPQPPRCTSRLAFPTLDGCLQRRKYVLLWLRVSLSPSLWPPVASTPAGRRSKSPPPTAPPRRRPVVHRLRACRWRTGCQGRGRGSNRRRGGPAASGTLTNARHSTRICEIMKKHGVAGGGADVGSGVHAQCPCERAEGRTQRRSRYHRGTP